MAQSSILTSLNYVYWGQIIAFTLCQLLLLRADNKTQVFLWICASSLTALSVANTPHVATVFSNRDLIIWSAFLSLLGGLIRYGALGFQSKGWQRDRKAHILFLVSIVGTPLAFFDILIDYRGIIVSVIGLTISLACLLAAKHNRYWASNNQFGLILVLIGMGISAALMAARMLTTHPIGVEKSFIGSSGLQVLSTAAIVVISFVLQLGFTGMLAARQAKLKKFEDRRNARAWQRSEHGKARAIKLRDISEKRLDLIELLTHEIRQPINNAQASLQSIVLALDPKVTLTARAGHAWERASASLDHITLALSNFIVTATLAADAQKWDQTSIEAMEILEMARLDCNSADRRRIFIKRPENNIFLEGVPTLLRVALHNIFEHALSQVKIDSDISVSAEIDELKFGVTVSICFDMAREKSSIVIPYDQLSFKDTQPSQLANLGLYVARKIAIYHHGDLLFEEKNNHKMMLKLFIPN